MKVKNLSTKGMSKLNNNHLVWDNVTESEVKTSSSQQMDPVLKLYRQIQVLITKNIDIPNGIANRKQALLTSVHLKTNQNFSNVHVAVDDKQVKRVNAVYASQIVYIKLQHKNKDMLNPMFQMQPESIGFKA